MNHRPLVTVTPDAGVAILRLCDPARRNALSEPMFDALEEAVNQSSGDASCRAVLLCGSRAADGTPAFCAGFDLAAAANEPAIVAEFIRRLSVLLRAMRRLPQPVTAAVAGPAIAGGCAMLSACDFVVAAPDAVLGYPVHRVGISPAVSAVTLTQRIGNGHARRMMMSGDLIDGRGAHALGLVSHLAASADTVEDEALAHCHTLAAKPREAVGYTKRWLNELDGSLVDEPFTGPAADSAALAQGEEAAAMLTSWRDRQQEGRRAPSTSP